MGHDGVTVGERVGHEVIVCYLEECVDRGGLVPLTCRPGTHRAERWQHGGIWPEKEPRAALAGPGRKLVVARVDLIADLLDAEDALCGMARDKPIPERRAEVHAIVEILRLHEYVGVEEIRHQATPRLWLSSRKVESFEKPSNRKASRWRVWPPSVLATSARAKRLLTLIGS